MKKILGGLLIIVLAAIVFLIVAKDWVLKAAVEQATTRLTGFETKLEDLKYDFPSTLLIKGLEIQNPAGFNQKIFVNIPEIYASLVFRELLTGQKIHLREVRLNIQDVNIEKNDKGISNVELLTSIAEKTPKDTTAGTAPAEKRPGMPFWLEKMELTIRNVSFEDRSTLMGVAPVVPRKLALDLNVQKEIFTDIHDPQVFVNLIVVKVLNSATLGRLLNIEPQKLLQENVGSLLSAGNQLAAKSTELLTEGEVSQKAEQLLKGTAGEAKEGLSAASSVVKDQVSGLLGKLKPSMSAEEKPAQKTA